MSSRIDVRLAASLPAGLIAASPWLMLALAAGTLGLAGNPWLLVFCPPAVLGAAWQVKASGLLQSPDSVVRLTVEEGQLRVYLADGRSLPASPTSDSRLFGELALLRLTLGRSTLKPPLVVLFSSSDTRRAFGNVPADSFRRLRVWLRLASPARTVTSD
ncbi:hypothetical protein [Marinobacter sp.]|uniref:hypothetical protein n=1 Tax=Marinobacter sp. TaxID=50741 RepID=UPI00384E630B